MLLTQNYRFGEIGPNTEICSNLHEIWHSQQMEHANWLRKITLSFFYKQPASKQLALGWQIAKKLSGLNPLSLSNNKNYGLKKGGFFPL